MLRVLPSRRLISLTTTLALLCVFYFLGLPSITGLFERWAKARGGPPYHKPSRNDEYTPVQENFPIAAHARTSADLPPQPTWMQSQPKKNATTPLFIGFTRNWPVLQQAVTSYLAAGWPAHQIYVVENTGTMDANELGQLSLQNQFYIDYERLTRIFGVNVISTPTLLTFSQLQNFFLHTAIQNKWAFYFWAHMDCVVVSDEKVAPFESFYTRLANLFEQVTTAPNPQWAAYFFAYDHLTLANTAAYRALGGFDSMISFYLSDCDFYERIKMAGYTIETANVGHIIDVGATLPDLAVLYHTEFECPGDVDEAKKPYGLNDCRHEWLMGTLNDMAHVKATNEDGRNFWQSTQRGGQGEPFYVDPRGFEWMIRTTKKHGTDIYIQKWGHWRCNLFDVGYKLGDAWNVQQEVHYTGISWFINQDREDTLDTTEM